MTGKDDDNGAVKLKFDDGKEAEFPIECIVQDLAYMLRRKDEKSKYIRKGEATVKIGHDSIFKSYCKRMYPGRGGWTQALADR